MILVLIYITDYIHTYLCHFFKAGHKGFDETVKVTLRKVSLHQLSISFAEWPCCNSQSLHWALLLLTFVSWGWKCVQISLTQTKITEGKLLVHCILPWAHVRMLIFKLQASKWHMFCYRGHGNKFFIQW